MARKILDFGGNDDIIFTLENNVVFILLNREKLLNAINDNIAIALFEALKAFEVDDSIVAVVIEGAGRAFCSGGDVVAAYHKGKAGAPAYDFFRIEYLFNIYLNNYKKPYIALLDGLVMGGGAGMSAYGKYRIVTENTVFAMPEANIGFFTDIGAAYFLQSTNLSLRLYLCLTGARIDWGDCLYIGFGTHCIESQHLPQIKTALVQHLAGLRWQKTASNAEIFAKIDKLLQAYIFPVASKITKHLDVIERCFNKPSLDLCLAELYLCSQQGSEFATASLKMLGPLSSLSLKVIYKHVTEANDISLENCMKMEYRITSNMLKSHDFYEGIRAALIDKDKAPKWKYNDISQIPAQEVDEYFLPQNDELW